MQAESAYRKGDWQLTPPWTTADGAIAEGRIADILMAHGAPQQSTSHPNRGNKLPVSRNYLAKCRSLAITNRARLPTSSKHAVARPRPFASTRKNSPFTNNSATCAHSPSPRARLRYP